MFSSAAQIWCAFRFANCEREKWQYSYRKKSNNFDTFTDNEIPLALLRDYKLKINVIKFHSKILSEFWETGQKSVVDRACVFSCILVVDSWVRLAIIVTPVQYVVMNYDYVHVYIVGWSLQLQSFVCWCWISSSVSLVHYHHICSRGLSPINQSDISLPYHFPSPFYLFPAANRPVPQNYVSR